MSRAHPLPAPVGSSPLHGTRALLGRVASPLAAILVTTTLSALLGLLAARGAALLLLGEEPPRSGSSGQLALEPPLADRDDDADAVTSRNIFCSGCPRGAPPPPAADARPRGGSAPEASLLATVRDPAARSPSVEGCAGTGRPHGGSGSWALLATAGPGSARWLRPGSVLGGAEVTAILADRVCYRDARGGGEWRWDGRREVSRSPTGAHHPSKSEESAIQRVGPDRYRVSRRWLALALRDLGGLLGQAGGRPEVRGGRWVGFRLGALPTNRQVPALGLRSGDVVLSVNGRALDSVDALLGLITTLPGARHVAVDLERGGRLRTLTYEID